jgi:tetratricopeptide (TPR) repeat protein
VVRATLVETSSNRELAQFRQNASSGDAIISAADKIGRDVRGQLGASLKEVRASPPLAFAVTPSLPALREYSEAIRLAADLGERDEPVRRLENAVQIDTEFASAYRLLASYAANVGELARSDWAAGRAFTYREKLPPATRLMVEGTYFDSPSGFDVKRAIATYQRIVDANPRNTAARNNLGMAYLRNREFDRAVEAFLKNVEFDSVSSFSPYNIVRAYWAAGRRQEARKYISERLSKWQAASTMVLNSTALALSADLEIDSAVMTLERSIKAVPSPLAGDPRAATLAALFTEQGRLNAGVETYAKFQPAAADTIAILGRAPIRLAVDDWLRNRPEALRKYLDSITVAHPPGNATAFEYPWLDLSTLYAHAGAPDRAKIFLAGFERSATRSMQEFNRQRLEMARGWIAIAERRYDDAIRSLRSGDSGDCGLCPLPPLAHAYDLASQTDSAIAVFERYVAANDLSRVLIDQVYLAGAYKRLGELYEAKADRQNAVHYYAKFVDLWKNADPDLQPFVAEVRKRLARLSESERK